MGLGLGGPRGRDPHDRIADALEDGNRLRARMVVALEGILHGGTGGGNSAGHAELKAILVDIQGKVGILTGAQQAAIDKIAADLRKVNDADASALDDRT